jgi:WD40 repeat protein
VSQKGSGPPIWNPKHLRDSGRRYNLASSVLTKASKVLLFTGGDDNAVHLTEVNLNSEISTRNISSVPDAHASTITGVLHLGDMHFLSCGIDQAVKVWRLEGEKLVCLYKCHTGVPDVGGIVEIGGDLGKRRFVVFGTGMEMIAWNRLQENGSPS